MATLKPSDITLDDAIRRGADVTAVELDGEAILYRQGGMHRLDPLGTVLWNCFDGETTLRELVTDLCSLYDSDRESITRDVLAFARQMGRAGLLEGVASHG